MGSKRFENSMVHRESERLKESEPLLRDRNECCRRLSCAACRVSPPSPVEP